MPRTPLSWSALGLDLVTLRVFKAAVEERSLARAAEREHLALSALSRRIAEMEARLGTALLRRHDRGVEPTAAGAVLLRHLGPLFDLLDRAFADVEAFAAGARGHVRLHANISAVAGFLPGALAGFLTANPGIEVSLEERWTSDILHAVRIGAADLGLGSGTVRDAPAELHLIPWREDRLVAVLPRGHPLARHAAPLRFAALAAEPFVGLSAASALQQLYRREAEALGTALRERIGVASFDGVRRMVEAGLGVAILPDTALRDAGPGVVLRPIEEPWAHRPLTLCVRRDTEALPAAARLLAAHLLGREFPIREG
ncbi:LysR family transcriptional regulator [Paracraurococcus ruber]|nr:LysR family transcriptional regulator [Paracraurococcus ruber]